jgi:hypothetical protein
LITIVILSSIISLAWTLLDRRRKNYEELDYWFRAYLAYYLFIGMDFYAMFKMNLAQMPFPNAADKLNLLFNTIGVSPGYSILTGVFEFLAAALLLSRKTRAAGALLLMGVLINIVSLNLCYNVNVKLLSILMLCVDGYLLAPYLPGLINFFCFSGTTTLPLEQLVFNTKWKRIVFCVASVLIPVWVTVGLFVRSNHVKSILKAQKQDYYEVTTFISGKDTLAPLLTDTLRIKNILFTAFYAHKYVVIYNMRDSAINYDYQWNARRDNIRLTPFNKGMDIIEFSYKNVSNQELELSGSYNNHQVRISCKKKPLNDLPILRDKFSWVEGM